jgi:antitoxin component of MazEF toxin-antitoxin module
MRQISNSINLSGRIMMAAALLAVVALTLPAGAEAQMRRGDRVEASVDGDNDRQTRRERRRERLAERRERIRERIAERREARREFREQRREAAGERQGRWHRPLRDRQAAARHRYDRWYHSRPDTWRHRNLQRPVRRPVAPWYQHNTGYRHPYAERQRYMAWRRQQEYRAWRRQQAMYNRPYYRGFYRY